MSVLGVLICGISVAMFKHAALGVDPFQSLMSGLNAVIPISFGTLYVMANLLLLSFSFFMDRKKIGIATVINLLFLGYVAEWMQNLLANNEAVKNIYEAIFKNMYFYNLIPFVTVLIVLAFTSKRSRAPKAEGIPYDKGAR